MYIQKNDLTGRFTNQPVGLMTMRFHLPAFLTGMLWLLAACTSTETKKQPTAPPLFTSLPADSTGVTFNNTLTEGLNTNVLMYEYFYNGGGVAAGDVNGGGLTDIYFTANMGANQFY